MCFRRDLKLSRDDAFLIFAGNLFHKVGAATLNDNNVAVAADDDDDYDDNNNIHLVKKPRLTKLRVPKYLNNATNHIIFYGFNET